MSIKDDLYSRLSADAGVSALVGTRIYPNSAPQSATLPYIVLTRIAAPHFHHLTAAAGAVAARWQIDCYGEGSPEAEDVAEAVRDSLQGFYGTMGSTFIQSCHLVDENDGYVEPELGEAVEIARITQDYRIAYSESVPTF